MKWVVAVWGIAATVFATAAALPSRASTIRVVIPSLVGEWFVGESSGRIAFDLGTHPTQAHITLGMFPNHRSLSVFLAGSLGVASAANPLPERFDWLSFPVSRPSSSSPPM